VHTNNQIEKDILKHLKINPVIPCISSLDEIFIPEYDKIKVILLYDLNIFDLLTIVKKNTNYKKYIILNTDTIKGIASDEYGLTFLKKYLKINIIATSSPKIINCAKKIDLTVVQTIFVFDTKSLQKGINLIKTGKPNFTDIRPGILYLKTFSFLKKNLNNIPIICSGLIKKKSEVQSILENGATAVTTSNKDLWNLYL